MPLRLISRPLVLLLPGLNADDTVESLFQPIWRWWLRNWRGPGAWCRAAGTIFYRLPYIVLFKQHNREAVFVHCPLASMWKRPTLAVADTCASLRSYFMEPEDWRKGTYSSEALPSNKPFWNEALSALDTTCMTSGFMLTSTRRGRFFWTRFLPAWWY